MKLSRLLDLSARFLRQYGIKEVFLWAAFVYFGLRLAGKANATLTIVVVLLGAAAAWPGHHRSDHLFVAQVAIGAGLLIYLKTNEFGLPGIMAAAAATLIIYLIYASAVSQYDDDNI